MENFETAEPVVSPKKSLFTEIEAASADRVRRAERAINFLDSSAVEKAQNTPEDLSLEEINMIFAAIGEPAGSNDYRFISTQASLKGLDLSQLRIKILAGVYESSAFRKNFQTDQSSGVMNQEISEYVGHYAFRGYDGELRLLSKAGAQDYLTEIEIGNEKIEITRIKSLAKVNDLVYANIEANGRGYVLQGLEIIELTSRQNKAPVAPNGLAVFEVEGVQFLDFSYPEEIKYDDARDIDGNLIVIMPDERVIRRLLPSGEGWTAELSKPDGTTEWIPVKFVDGEFQYDIQVKNPEPTQREPEKRPTGWRSAFWG